MPLFTSTSLKERSLHKSFSEENKILNESKKTHNSFDIFLSHSFLDKQDVEGLYLTLTKSGYSVYVDWIIDPHLSRQNVTKSTAETIRERMNASKSLLFAISTNAGFSKWMPWELGYVDGKTGRCAILPVSQDRIAPTHFTRSEYLLLYPYLKPARVDFFEDLYITESANNYVTLDKWLSRGETPSYKTINIDML